MIQSKAGMKNTRKFRRSLRHAELLRERRFRDKVMLHALRVLAQSIDFSNRFSSEYDRKFLEGGYGQQ